MLLLLYGYTYNKPAPIIFTHESGKEYIVTNIAELKQGNYKTGDVVTGILLTQKSQQAIPSRVTGGMIHFTIRDCFGNTKAIELPFKIKVNAVPSAARKH